MDRFIIKKPRLCHSIDVVPSTSKNVTSSSGKGDNNASGVSEVTVESDVFTSKPAKDEKCLKKTHKRNFQEKWKSIFPWLIYNKTVDVVYCQYCREAYSKNLVTFSSKYDLTFVNVGFKNWKKALEKYRVHEKSDCHSECVLAVTNVNAGVNVCGQISSAKELQMKESRVALLKILSSLQFLAIQGLAIRGHTDDVSNLINLLRVRSDDCAELKKWMNRSSYKWYSHDICNEMLEIMSHTVLGDIIKSIQRAKYYGIMVDESSDISVKEQVSLCFRTVNENLDVEENFVGFYETSKTDAETLFHIINDVLVRFNIDISKCRGQCYDGASNMAGKYSGVQARLSEKEPRALFVHCLAHSLNLVVQDTIRNISGTRNVLNLVKEIIVFVRHSPKRLSFFKQLQVDDSVNLRPFCPTRWVVRFVSLSSFNSNYEQLIEFLESLSETDSSDIGAKANGFCIQMQSFNFYFYLCLLCKIFCHIDAVNTALQKKTLCFQEAYAMVQRLADTFRHIRTTYDAFWEETFNSAQSLNLQEPQLPRQRRTPKRIDPGSAPYSFDTPKNMYRSMFYEVVDVSIQCLITRFESIASSLLVNVEKFVTNNSDDIADIADFFKDDFDPGRLTLHRNMMIDMVKSKVNSNPLHNFSSVIEFLKSDNCALQMLPELTELVRLVLTVPMSTCTAERSFSSLRRLKNYLRSSMGQSRLNSIAILNCHRNISSTLDLDGIADQFIGRTEHRRQTFSMRKQ